MRVYIISIDDPMLNALRSALYVLEDKQMGKKKNTEAVKSEETAPQTESNESPKSEFDEANEAALKEAEKAAETATPEEDVPPAGACEVWGQADPNSKCCKSCEVFRACTDKTAASKKSSKKTSAAAKEPGAPRAPRVRTGDVSKFNLADKGTQSGIIDTALEVFRTHAELEAVTGFTRSRITSHIKWLETKRADRCKKVVGSDGKFKFVLLSEVEEQKAA